MTKEDEREVARGNDVIWRGKMHSFCFRCRSTGKNLLTDFRWSCAVHVDVQIQLYVLNFTCFFRGHNPVWLRGTFFDCCWTEAQLQRS